MVVGEHDLDLGESREKKNKKESNTFLLERISHQQPAATSQQYSSLRTNQHQPSATSQPNRLGDGSAVICWSLGEISNGTHHVRGKGRRQWTVGSTARKESPGWQ
jgi:hypothetical protein